MLHPYAIIRALFGGTMPIYAYRCTSCGYEKDVLQKMSDAILTTCPECKTASFTKQVTAAGFQLKGSGWYATDFKDGGKAAAESKSDAKSEPKAETTPSTKATAPTAPASPAASTAAPAPAPTKTASTPT
jgi:putative FmdB family regulatory protein